MRQLSRAVDNLPSFICLSRIVNWRSFVMNRRIIALFLGLSGAALAAPSLAFAYDRLAEAISHSKAIDDGTQNHADV